MRSPFHSLMLALALLVTIVAGARAQGSQALLDEVMVLTPRSLRDLMTVAESGDTTAQVKVGLAYYYGYGVQSIPEEAARWFRRAAERDCAAGQHMLGVQYRDGNGVDQDAGEAHRLLSAAAERGYPDAQYDFGLMLFEGTGVPQNYPEAFGWFTKAAAQGSPGGRTFVGIMLVNGLGVKQDLAAGRDALLDAAKRGSVMAQANLGALYANGVGVEQSNREALVWFYMAEAGGFGGVSQYIDGMTQGMAESEVADIRREAEQRTQRFLSEANGDASAGAGPSLVLDAAAAAALEAIGASLVPTLTEFGTFTIDVFPQAGRTGRGRGAGGRSSAARNTLTDVKLTGCRLHFVEAILLDPAGQPDRWEWVIDLAGVDASQLRVQQWELPEGWRAASGQGFEVYLRAARDRSGRPVRGVAADGRTEELKAGLHFRDREHADIVLEKVREIVEICGGG
ncbi:MAG TPA: tetratricopeptide repeat protein [Gemmatimonadales bacterium]|jgi:hypothetical protein